MADFAKFVLPISDKTLDLLRTAVEDKNVTGKAREEIVIACFELNSILRSYPSWEISDTEDTYLVYMYVKESLANVAKYF